MAIGFGKSKKASELSQEKKTKIWNLTNNQTFEMELLRFNKLMEANKKAMSKKSNPVYSDFAKRNYKIDEYPGEPRALYHLVKLEKITITDELLDEIKLRNPVEPNMPKMPNGDPFAWWKVFLGTASSIKASMPVESIVKENLTIQKEDTAIDPTITEIKKRGRKLKEQ